MSCDRLGSFDDDPRAPASDGGGFYKGAGEWIFGSAGLSMLRNSDNASREGWEQSDCQREQLRLASRDREETTRRPGPRGRAERLMTSCPVGAVPLSRLASPDDRDSRRRHVLRITCVWVSGQWTLKRVVCESTHIHAYLFLHVYFPAGLQCQRSHRTIDL